MNYDEATDMLNKTPFKYAVVGFKFNGIRVKPLQFDIDAVFATDESIFNEVNAFEVARVFSISEIGNPKYWRERTKAFFDNKTTTEEKELLAKLKEKYPE